jgi:hypothetical protein
VTEPDQLDDDLREWPREAYRVGEHRGPAAGVARRREHRRPGLSAAWTPVAGG